MKSKKIILILITLFLAVFFTIPSMGEEISKKKFLMIKDDDSDFFNGFATFIEKELRAKGYTPEKVEYKTLSMNGKSSNGTAIMKEILEYKPSVVYINCIYMKEIILPLKKANIPTVIVGNINYEEDGKKVFLDDNNMPNGSVVGLYLSIENIELNTFKIMEMIVPLKGKKIALLIGNSTAKEEIYEKAAKDFGAKLKVYKKVEYMEDMLKLIHKVNSDNEIGWVILSPTFNRKDGKESNRDENFKILYQSLKKPDINYFQYDVEKGSLMALTFDSTGMVLQCLNMAYKILDGEKPQNIKPEYPKKSLLLFNNASAKRLGITIPQNVLEGAWRYYTDYDGHFVGQK